MKKSSFAALVLGTVSGVLFALGMCMALIPEWNALVPGIVLGCAGLAVGAVTLTVWRRMTNRPSISFSRKVLLNTAVGVTGALLLGVGMCFCMVWNRMIPGVLIGLLGIVTLLCLIPLVKGIRE